MLIRKTGEPIFIEYTSSDRNLALSITQASAQISKDSNNITYHQTVNTGLYTNIAQDFLGPLFRGWGQFAFKGNVNSVPLDESKLNQNEMNNYPTDPTIYMDSSKFSQLQDPSKTNFVTLYPNAENNVWSGYDTAIYVGNTTMASSRLWMHDVSVDYLMAGQSVSAVSKISTTNVNSTSVGFTYLVSASEGFTNAVTTTNLDMMDMNGAQISRCCNWQ